MKRQYRVYALAIITGGFALFCRLDAWSVIDGILVATLAQELVRMMME